MTAHTGSALARCEFREQLLPRTILHAFEQSHFYAALWGPAVGTVRRIDDLSALPMVNKVLLSQSFEDLLTSNEVPALVQQTSGTGGTPLPIYRSSREIDFIKFFFSKAIGSSPAGLAPVVLNLTDTYHGPPIEIPGHNYTIPVSITDDAMLAEACRLVAEPLRIPGVQRHVSAIVGLVPYIKIFTAHLIDRGFDFAASRVSVIVPIATALSGRWRSLLSDTWGAQVIDRYSLSEIFGGATLCSDCRNYHFDATVIPEVVHPISGSRISSGVGILVLTCLYPFVQMQPMIRYRTDDLVEISQDSCQTDLSVKFLGRLANACIVGGEVLVHPMDVHDILDGCPDVASTGRLYDLATVKDHTAGGVPIFGWEVRSDATEHVTVTWRVGLRYSPKLYPDSSSALAHRLESALLSKSPKLKRYISDARCTLRVELLPFSELSAPARKI